MKKQISNKSVTKGERVNLTLNSKQVEIIESLVGEMGDNKSDVVKTIFTSWLSEKGIASGLVKKRLDLP